MTYESVLFCVIVVAAGVVLALWVGSGLMAARDLLESMRIEPPEEEIDT